MEIIRSIYQQVVYRFAGYGATRLKPIRVIKELADGYLMRGLPEGVYRVNGFRMRLRSEEIGLALAGFSERYVTEYFSRVLRPGMTVVDIGANIGYFTLLFARLVGAEGRVIAFEAEPSNCELLEENLALNELHNVTLVPKAISNKGGILRLYLSPTNLGGHTCYPTEDHAQSIEVEATTLDDYVREAGIGAIDAIKMDIEGFEYFALQGIGRALRESPTLKLVMEFTPPLMKQAGVRAEMLLELLDKMGLSYVYIIRRGVAPVDRERLAQLRSGAMLVCSRQPTQ